jgi:predicted transcriptional regulator
LVQQDYAARQLRMRRSKLETYESILEVLVDGSLDIERIAYEANLDCTILERHLEFLMKNELIEERPSEYAIVYAITERGVAVLRALNFQKYLGRIKNTLRAIDEAMQVLPDISDRQKNRANKTEV